MDKYAAKARAKWGETKAYQEFCRKTAGQTPAQMTATGEALMDIRTLFKGDEIAVYKTDETWQLSLNNLMEMNF